MINPLTLLPPLFQRFPRQTRSIIQNSLFGLVGGGAAVLFQTTLNSIYRKGLVDLSTHSMLIFLLGSFILIVLSSLAVGWLLNSFCPEATGSGIPQLKLAFWKDFGYVPLRVVWVKFIAGVISVGGGLSLGREGPSVQLAGAVASNLASITGEPKQNRRAAAAAGAAAGLAAAFNTPLAATTFVLEEIIGDLNSRLLGGVLLASVLGALVVHGAVGKQPAFTLIGPNSPSWLGYALTPAVALMAGYVGVHFQRNSLDLRKRMKQSSPVPRWLLPLYGGLITWILGVTVFWRTGHLGVFGLGYDDLSSALAGNIGWQLALVLLITKFIATFTCYGFGGCGGIFSPTLFFGGMIGTLVAGVVGIEWHMAHADMLTLTVVGMSACLGAVVGAPVTGILIVFEMTHEFALVPALMIGALVSQAISRKMNRENFYEALLTQDGHRIEHVRPPRDMEGWQKLPISAIANFQPVIITDLTPAAIRSTLERHPYQNFPVVLEGKNRGILNRKIAELSLSENRTPTLQPAPVCLRDQTVEQLQTLLLNSDVYLVLVLDHPGGQPIGLVTLHDLLRAEATIAHQSKEGE